MSVVKILRVLRVLRPLRAINRAKGLKVGERVTPGTVIHLTLDHGEVVEAGPRYCQLSALTYVCS
jgi:hypothetical protein